MKFMVLYRVYTIIIMFNSWLLKRWKYFTEFLLARMNEDCKEFSSGVAR